MKKISVRRLSILILSLAIGLLLVFTDLVPMATVAVASPVKVESSHGLVMYKSQTTLRDVLGSPWNITVFKQMYPDGVENLQLRITGGTAEVAIAKSQPLILTNDGGMRLEAANTSAEVFNPERAASPMQQFNLQPIFNQVVNQARTDGNWQLQLWQTDQHLLTLPIPAEVIQEWQMVASCQGLLCGS